MRINVSKEALAAFATAAALVATPAFAQTNQQTATIDQSITNEYDQRTYNTTNEYDQRTTNNYDQRTTNEYDQRAYTTNTTNEYDQRDYSTNVSNDSTSNSKAILNVADGAITNNIGGAEIDARDQSTTNIDASTTVAEGAVKNYTDVNVGGPEIDNRDYSQTNVDASIKEGAITNNIGGAEVDARSYTDVTTGPTNVDVTTGPTNVDASIKEGAIQNNIGGAEIDNRDYSSNTQTVGDTTVNTGDVNVSGPEIDARNQQQIDASNAGNNSEQNVVNEIDARNQQQIDNGNDIDVEGSKQQQGQQQDQTQNNQQSQVNEGNNSNQSTEVDARNSGNNSSNVNEGNNASQSQENSGNSTNNIDASNHSVYRGASAANIPQAASMFALKACVGSTSVGIGGGSVYGLYGGISFNHTGSGAVNVTFEGPDGQEMAVTIPELSDMSPRSRAHALSGLNEKGQKLAMCLTSQFDAAKRQMEIDYKKAVGVASINAQAGVAIAEINSHRDQQVTTIRAASDNLQIAMRHNCGMEIHSRGGNHPQEVATGGSAPANRRFADGSLTEHGFCYETGAKMADVISGERERPATPRFETPALDAKKESVFELDM